MVLVPKQLYSCSFRFFTLVLNLIFLTSFDGNKYALAVFLGPDARFPLPTIDPWDFWHQLIRAHTPETSDYPSDDDIQRNFFGTGPDQTLMMAISKTYLPQYWEYCTTSDLRLKCVYFSFPMGYLNRIDRNGKERSRRWARDFYARYNAVYMGGASGTVYVLTDRAIPPRICGYFDEIIHQLQLNKKVMGIILVSALDWNEQRVYWIRPDDYDESEVSDGSRDGGPGGTENWNGNTFLGPAASLIVPLAVSRPIDATLNAAGAIDALKSTIHLTLPVYSGDGKDNDPGLKPLEFPLKTDILHLPMASLSSPDDKAIGTSGENTISSLDETSALQPQTDEISSTGKTSSTESTSERTPANDKVTDPGFEIDGPFKIDDDISLLERRRRALLPRDSDDCLDWLTESDFPLNPSQLDAAAGTSAHPVSPPSTQTDWNVEKLYIFAKEDVATLLVTQHDKASANDNFKLDISILDSEGNMIQNEQGVDAPTEKEIEVPVPWNVKLPMNSPGIEAPFSWPLYSTGKNKQDPIQIRYGDPLLIGPETDWGWTFDSSDARHKCVVTDWIDSKREIQCSFVVAHPSLP